MSPITRRRSTEADLEEELAGFLDATGLFRVFRQVRGRSLWTACPAAGWLRCDFLLLASRRGLAAGWRHGPILLEVKRPGEPLGRAISQMLDYLRASWTLPNGVPVLASWAFAYPFAQVNGALASVMAQARVGTASLDAGELRLCCGEHQVLSIVAGGLKVGETGIGIEHGPEPAGGA
jgi:hypothetical protein